jgi:hypothetical protein
VCDVCADAGPQEEGLVKDVRRTLDKRIAKHADYSNQTYRRNHPEEPVEQTARHAAVSEGGRWRFIQPGIGFEHKGQL